VARESYVQVAGLIQSNYLASDATSYVGGKNGLCLPISLPFMFLDA